MRRLLTIALVLGACALAFVLTGASEESESKPKFKVVFDNAFGLVEGGDFRVGGVTAGQTKSFDITKTKSGASKAIVEVEVTEPGFDSFRKDATCTIKPQSLIGEYYVDCQPGSSDKRLQDGGTVPVEQTESTIPQDLVNNILRRPYRERFRLIVTELGTGLAGRPQDLQAVLKRAHPGLRETSKVLRLLGRQNRIIENFITDSDTVVTELERNKRDVVRFIDEAGETAEISATRREEIRQSFRKLPGFLDRLRPYMARLGEVADEQTPLLADLERAAPDLTTFLERLGPFTQASRPAIRSLGDLSVVGRRAFEKGAQEVEELRKLAPEAAPTFKPFRQFLESMDDRRRAIDDDPRAKVNGPPAPDRTATGTGGFTGFEAIFNYPFWQTLSLNAYDDVGHMLRLGVTLTKCSDLVTDLRPNTRPADKAFLDDCSQWLGPNLPGITTRDFTDGSNPASLRERAEKPARRVGERRGPGEPDAGPVPGQRDISKPQVTLPPQLKQLLDDLPRLGQDKNAPRLDDLLGTGGARGGSSDAQLLDFLLGP